MPWIPSAVKWPELLWSAGFGGIFPFLGVGLELSSVEATTDQSYHLLIRIRSASVSSGASFRFIQLHMHAGYPPLSIRREFGRFYVRARVPSAKQRPSCRGTSVRKEPSAERQWPRQFVHFGAHSFKWTITTTKLNLLPTQYRNSIVQRRQGGKRHKKGKS